MEAQIALNDIWTTAGVLLGFEVTSFLWRVANEVERSKEGDITWLPPADMVNLAAMTVLVLGVFITPTLALHCAFSPSTALGLSATLFIGHCFCLAGHYEMFNHNSMRSMVYFPLQERVCVALVSVAAVLYVIAALYA